jgi:hypothetical protein
MGIAQHKVKVVDAQTGLPLAFVNIRFDDSKHGCSSDINGRFEVPERPAIKVLKCSYVGYLDTLVILESLLAKSPYVIKMQSTQYALKEIMILPGINPAHRIIQNTIDHRKQNNPEKLNSFSYKAYHKMVFTADSQFVGTPDSLQYNGLDTVGVDSSEIRMREFLEKQHLFMMESVSERKYLKPDRSTEKVLATRISGMQAPLFALLATQFQSFSFYSPLVNVAGQEYVNPISRGSTNKYFFKLEDTLYDASDTVFVIAFRPLWGKNFEGLKGVLYIHSADWAIKSVIAEPFEQNENLGIRIEQLYEPNDSGVWFPVQLNTRLMFSSIQLNGSDLVGIGHTYLDDVKINPEIKAREFNHVVIEMASDAGAKDQEYWGKYRVDSLNLKEQMTYHVMDSLGEELNTDRWYKAFQILTTGQIPMGKLSLDIDKFYQYNQYEKSRIGMGMRTNDRLIPWWIGRGYFAYGFGDKAWKYGLGMDFYLNKYYDMALKLDYVNDLEEVGEHEKFGRPGFLNTEFARNVLRKDFVFTESYKAQFTSRLLKHFKWEVGFENSMRNTTNNYLFKSVSGDVDVWQSDYRFTEVSLGMRFGFREKFIMESQGLTSLGTKYPVIQVRFHQGIKGLLGGQFDYQRIDAQLDYKVSTRYIGKTKLRITGGMVMSDLPAYELYHGKGSAAKFFLHASNTFNTMRVGEFLSDRYVAAYLEHNFGNLLLKTEYFAPELVLVSSATYGELSNPDLHRNITYQTLEKGYFESGLLINNLMRSVFSGLGVGVYYRYGPYQYSSVKDSLFFKLSSSMSF